MKKLIITVGALLLSTLGSATPANVTTADVSGNTWQFRTLACQIPPQKRKDCHRKSSNGIQCTSYGCCWDQGHKKCYEAKLMPAPPGCQNSNTNKTNWCKRSQTSYPPAVDRRVWQTPPQGEPDYRDSFKTYRNFQAYASIKYSNPSPYVRTATVEVITFKRVSNLQLLYKFEPYQSSWTSYDKITITQDQKLPLKIKVFSPQTEQTLELDEIYFTWMNPAVNAPHTKDGRKGAIVELFGWPFNDIAQECTMLGKAGYLGVRIWPPNEHIQSDHYLFEDSYNPWWVVYQPVSYRTVSRMGTRQELYNMIKTCREKGVRIYADAVLNHMSGGGNDVQNHRNDECAVWGPKNASAGSPYFTHSWTFGANRFTHQQPALEFPAVPFHASHFHCERAMPLPTTNGIELSAGWLLGLTDLNTEHPYVQQRLADYLTDLLSMGISGFRLDAAKHIKPASIAKIISLVRKNMGGTLPKDFLAYLEVTLYPEDWDFVACKYSEYSFYQFLDDQLKHYGLSPEERDSIKLWSADYPAFFPVCGKWILPQERFVIQNDDHGMD
ncbi:glycoside hydrolase superfamily [Paraphysoderma sedebokerense]|nr:glycoside hydrolase superfamily [Paraphysoderma sedebokerense]